LFDNRKAQEKVTRWAKAQPSLPSRKETQKQFPDLPHKIIRSALQSLRDRHVPDQRHADSA